MGEDERKIVLEMTPDEAVHAANALSHDQWQARMLPEEYWQNHAKVVHAVWRRLDEAIDKRD